MHKYQIRMTSTVQQYIENNQQTNCFIMIVCSYLQKYYYNFGAKGLRLTVHLAFALKNQRVFHIEGRIYAEVFHFGFIPVAEIIKPEAVQIGIYYFF